MTSTNKTQKIIFLDIDGPMIPARAYRMANQTKPLVSKFDPCAVGILNDLCADSGWRIVLHTSWVRIQGGRETYEHCLKEGLGWRFFHEDAWCDEDEHWRYTRVAKWLDKHPEITHYLILDDEPYAADIYNYEHPNDLENHLILVDFDDGILKSTVNKIRGGDWRANKP